jgi:hypothetical protein
MIGTLQVKELPNSAGWWLWWPGRRRLRPCNLSNFGHLGLLWLQGMPHLWRLVLMLLLVRDTCLSCSSCYPSVEETYPFKHQGTWYSSCGCYWPISGDHSCAGSVIASHLTWWLSGAAGVGLVGQPAPVNGFAEDTHDLHRRYPTAWRQAVAKGSVSITNLTVTASESG